MRAALFCVGWLAGWILSAVIPLPLLWYLPAERAFVFAAHAPQPGGIDFYGRLLFAGACGALAALLPRRLFETRTLLVWTASLLAMAATLHLWTLSRRQPVPIQPPPRYGVR